MATGGVVNSSQVCGEIFCEFLEVAIHTILYMRNIYPAGVFEKRKKYRVPVQICVHPGVSQFILQTVEGVKRLQANNQVQKVTVVIMAVDGSPVERFVFEVSTPSGDISGTDKYLLHLEDSLRAFLLRLNVCDSVLKPISDDIEKTWTVHVHTKDSAALKLEEQQKSFPWVNVDEDKINLTDPKIVPLKGTNSDIFKMQLYVEEPKVEERG